MMWILAALAEDLRHAARALRRTPGFTAAAMLTLSLGIGATTVVFSIVNTVLLRPLPYPEPEQVVGIWSAWEGTASGAVSPGEYFDYLRNTRSFEHLGIFGTGTLTLTAPGTEAEQLNAAFVTFGVLPTLGVSPAIGSTFTSSDDDPGSDGKAILTDELWRRRFGRAPGVLGTRVMLDGESATVIGVLPPGFRLPHEFAAREPADILVPLAFPHEQAAVRGNHSFRGIARLKAGVSIDTGSAEIASVAAAFVRALPGEYPAGNRFTARVTPIADDVNGAATPRLTLLFGAIGFVLLIACSNVANLFLARSESHGRETAIRAAIGGGRWRLASYAFAEALTIAAGGGAVGLMLAAIGLRALPWLRPMDVPRLDSVALDWRAAAFASLASIAVAVLVGLTPAIRALRTGPQSALARDSRTMVSGRKPAVRQALIAAQVAAAIVLLFGATLLSASFRQLISVDPGYRVDGVLAADLSLPDSSYPDADRTSSFFVSLLASVRQQPGVAAAGAVANLPLAAGDGDLNIQIEGRETAPGTRSRRANWQVITPGYVEAMGLRVMRGRTISPDDRADTPGVVVISQSMAREYWPDADPIGARFRLGGGAGPGWVTVVGIVGDVRHNGLDESPQRQMYLAHTQFRFWGGSMQPARNMTVVVRTAGDPASLVPLLRREVRALDPSLPLGATRAMTDVLADSVSGPRFLTLLLGGFSLAAMLVALVGVYGVVAYSLAQRRREIGVRLALGASPAAVVLLIARHALVPGAAGLAAGVILSLALSGLIRGFLFEVDPRDPRMAAGVAATVAVAVLVACLAPARRAASIEPLGALRSE